MEGKEKGERKKKEDSEVKKLNYTLDFPIIWLSDIDAPNSLRNFNLSSLALMILLKISICCLMKIQCVLKCLYCILDHMRLSRF